MAPKKKQGNRKRTNISNRNWKIQSLKSKRKLSGGISNTNTNNECISRRKLRNTVKYNQEDCMKLIKQHKSELNTSVRKTYKCQVECRKKDAEVCKQKRRVQNIESELDRKRKQNTTYAAQLEQVRQEKAVALKQAKHFETELRKSEKSCNEAKGQTNELSKAKHKLVAQVKKIATKHKLIEDELLKNTKTLKRNQDEKKYLLKMKDLVFGKRPKPLRNIGSTCFMNAILQTLAWTPKFGSELQKQISDMHGITPDTCITDMTESAFNLICYTHNGNTTHSSSSVPREMQKSAREKNNIFEGCQQQDSFEMFNTIVNGLKEETISFYKKMIRDTKVQITDTEILRRYGAVRLFSGKFITVYKYSSCHHVESVFQSFTSITVPIIKGKTTEKCIDEDKGTRRRKLMEMNGSPAQFSQDCCSDPQCNHDRCGIICALSENKHGDSNEDIVFYDAKDVLYSPTTQNVETQIYEGDFMDDIPAMECLESMESRNNVHNPFDTIAGNVSFTTDIEKGLSQGLMKVETFPEDIISCRKCSIPAKTGSSFNKTLIFEPPHILVLHIDRFKKDNRRGLRKRNDMVTYPSTLDLSPFCSVGLQVYQNDTQSRLSYSLYGVVAHSGTMNSGHYEAYIKTSARSETLLYYDIFGKYLNSPDNIKTDMECFLEGQQIEMTGTDNVGSWFNVSDEYIHECSEHDAINNSDAYVLMYERL